ncbi:MAG: hypothetical protein FJW40_08935 [Acidobacteria bacterium]|nr:hypothetical protein [Acidobacteriota bacterium]
MAMSLLRGARHGRITRCYLLAVSAALAAERPAHDTYGGYTAVTRKATGWFRVEQIGERWTFITPEGHPYIALGANHVGKFFRDPEQNGAILSRFGGSRESAEAAVQAAVRELKLNAGEAYAPLLESLKPRLPRIEDVSYPGDKTRFDLFDPSVREEIRRHVGAQCRAFANDPWVLGIGFADQPVWTTPRMVYFRGLAASAPGKRRYVDWLRARYPDLQALNQAYGTGFSSFDDALGPFTADASRPAVRSDDPEFLAIAADSLYSLLRETVRQAAPHHLFFGEKFVLRLPPDAVLKAVGKHVDVFLTQALILSPRRPPEWQAFQADGYRREHALTGGKPMIVVDWASPFSLDETYDTERGTVKAERPASEDSARWLDAALREPYMVGVFMCQLIGVHGNDRWFPAGRMKRTYLRDEGTAFSTRAALLSAAHEATLKRVYGTLR